MAQEKRSEKKSRLFPILLMSLMGGFLWAIQGSPGFGGATGGAFAGLGWGLLWFYLSYEKQAVKTRPFNLGWIVLAITIGMSIGGLNGFGIYIGWLQGRFYLTYQALWIPITTPLGYVGLFFTGLQWGGNTGILMGWCGSKNPLKKKDWIIRILFGIGGALAAYGIIQLIPNLIYPYYGLGYYSNFTSCTECQKIMEITTTLALFNGTFFGFLLYEVYRREWRNVKLALTTALGFALSFAIFALWQLGWIYSGWQIDWWKVWEMSNGLGGGATFGIAHFQFNRPQASKEASTDRITRSHRHLKGEKLLGFYLPIWAVLILGIFDVLGGVLEMFKVSPELVIYLIVAGIVFIPTAFLFLHVIYKTMKTKLQNGEGWENVTNVPRHISFPLLIMIGYGYAVTIPPEITFSSLMLLVTYSLFLLGSFLVFSGIHMYRKRAPS